MARKRNEYPGYYAFYACFNEEGCTVEAVHLRTRATMLETIPWEAIYPGTSIVMNYDRYALITVREIDSAQAYNKTMRLFTKKWKNGGITV